MTCHSIMLESFIFQTYIKSFRLWYHPTVAIFHTSSNAIEITYKKQSPCSLVSTVANGSMLFENHLKEFNRDLEYFNFYETKTCITHAWKKYQTNMSRKRRPVSGYINNKYLSTNVSINEAFNIEKTSDFFDLVIFISITLLERYVVRYSRRPQSFNIQS